MPPLHSAKLKIDRAREHFDLLESLIHRFMEDCPYELAMQDEVNAGEYSFVIHFKKTPPDDWSTLIGEIVSVLP